MGNLQVWQLVIDVFLCGSIVYLAYRLAKTPQVLTKSPQLMELEVTLKTLVKEADQASSALNERLIKRQRSLEQLLFDLETMENRLNRSITSAEESKGMLDISVNRTKHSSSKLDESVETIVSEENSINIIDQTHPDHIDGATPEPPSFQKTQVKQENKTKELSKPKSNLNIYGEPIAAQSEVKEKTTLSASVTKEVKEPTPEEGQRLEKLYDAAENMLKAGEDLRAVANQTNLSIDELKLLSQVVAKEQAVANVSSTERVNTDPRLGVLGSIKRQRQIV